MSNQDLDDELSSHLEFQTRKHMAAGLSEAEARRRARIEFGGLDLTKEQCRDVDPWRSVESARRNLRYALRSLAKSPAFSLIAIAILAVGIGATVAAFGILDAVLFRRLAIPHPDELVRIGSIGREGRINRLPSTILSPLHDAKWLAGACGFNVSDEGAEVDGTLGTIQMMGFTGDCFRALGVRIQLGRPLLPEDDVAGAPAAAVITSEYWRKAFGARPDAIGRTIRLPGVSFTIVGIAEDRFTGLVLGFPVSVVIPLHQEPNQLGEVGKQTWWPVEIVARRAPGISAPQAAAALAAGTRSLLEQSVPPNYKATRRAQYLSNRLIAPSASGGIDYFMRNRFGQPLYALFALCAVILTIGCVNLAGLMLARALRRRKEVSVRLALGASRTHVATMLSLESSLLVIAGAAFAVPFVLAVDRLFLSFGNAVYGGFEMNLGFEPHALAFFAALVIAIAAALAGASAWQARRLCRQQDLHPGRAISYRHGSTQQILIAAQIALTLVLVAGAGLFASSLRAYYKLDLGVKTGHIFDLILAGNPAGYHNFAPKPYYRGLVQQVEAVPGTTGVALTRFVPYGTGLSLSPAAVTETGIPGQDLDVHVGFVTDSFFSMVGMRILHGRDFRRDEPGTGPVAILSQSLAERWNGATAVMGRHIRLGTAPEFQNLQVIGVVSDAQFDLAHPDQTRPPTVYLSNWQYADGISGYPIMLVKTAGGTLPIARLRQIVNGLGREYIDRFLSLDQEKDGALVEDRVMAYLSAAFGALALLLAATGLFGLLSYQVAGRTGEIGIRMALGARRGQIQWLVVQQVGSLLAAGSAAGVALSLLSGKALAGILFHVHPGDPRPLAAALGVLALTALAAAWLPARRAASVDPLIALRHE